MSARKGKAPIKDEVVIVLTRYEARQLQACIGNGWGDGDFGEWLGSKRRADACGRAMEKFDAACREARVADLAKE